MTRLDLIDRDRAVWGMNNFTPSTDENETIDALINAASNSIHKYCNRVFPANTYDEIHHGGNEKLFLKQFPIIEIERVMYDPQAVIEVENNSSTNQRAWVQVKKEGIKLMRTASGTTTTDESVTWASNATVSAVVTAIDALGNGWDATVVNSDYNNYDSEDLRAFQGGLGCKDKKVKLRMHVKDLSSFDYDEEAGWLTRDNMDQFIENDSLNFTRGSQYWRIQYTAGYETVPEDIQDACSQFVNFLFFQTKRDVGAHQDQVPGSYSRSFDGRIPEAVIRLIKPYRKIRI